MSFVEPIKNLAQLNLLPGMTVADFGSGIGAYTLAAAHLVSPGGKVYAIDVQKDLLLRLKQDAKREGLTEIEIIWGDVEVLGGSKLRDGIADVLLVANILFQTNSAYTLALEAKRILKPGGKVLIVDWQGSFGNLGPAESAIVTEEKARAIFEQAGFSFKGSFFAGDHHYGLIMIKK